MLGNILVRPKATYFNIRFLYATFYYDAFFYEYQHEKCKGNKKILQKAQSRLFVQASFSKVKGNFENSSQ